MTPTEPIELDTIETPSGGLLGLTPCPGIIGGGLTAPPEARINADLLGLRDWGADHLLTLMEEFELIAHQGGQLGELAKGQVGEGGWHHLPIPDGGVPDARWEHWWASTSDDLHACLADGGRIAIHCLAGMGRTGLVACRLLVEAGLAPEQALRRVRHARPGAVESREQEHYVLALGSR